MKLKDLLEIMDGSARYSISNVSDAKKPLCKHDFWMTYRGRSEWEMEIRNLTLIPRKKEDSGIGYDDVICLITLK